MMYDVKNKILGENSWSAILDFPKYRSNVKIDARNGNTILKLPENDIYHDGSNLS